MSLIHRLNALSPLHASPRERRALGKMVYCDGDRPDVDRYSVHWCEWHNGRARRGNYELDEATATDRAAIVDLIVRGEWDHLDRIRCGNEALGTYRDVTRDVADDVLQHCIDNEIALSSQMRGWLHDHLGIRAVEDAVCEHPYLDGDYHTGWDR